ncbi:MAG: hypothetical protein WBX11_13870 [Thiobacillaceae bacterium]
MIYSSSQAREDAANKEAQKPDQVWGQLDLFATERPDAVIITQPDRLGFEGVARIITVGHARRIFDLREMPFISFDNETRESFLAVLEKNGVEYFNIFGLRHKLGECSDQDYDREIDGLTFAQIDVEKILKPMIESGPTVVFSDSDPSVDKTVKNLLDLLSKAAIPYSRVIAENYN